MLDTKHFLILVGPRQTGKTTSLKQLHQYLDEQKRQCSYINLENPLVLEEVNKHPENLLKFTSFFQLNNGQKLFLLVDEVQYADDPSNLLKFLYDEYQNQLKIIATGSSSFYIDKKFSDSMMGRKRLIETGTLNFREFLHFTEHDDLVQELDFLTQQPEYRSLKKTQLESLLEEYMVFGGYPEVVLADSEQEKRIVLEGIATSITKKDLFDAGLTDDVKYAQLLKIIAAEVGGQLNLNEIIKSIKLSYYKAEEMVYVGRKAFIIDTVTPFFRNFRKEISKMPKVFMLDNGLRNFLMNDFRRPSQRQDKGQLLENYIFRLFWDRYRSDQLHYWRTADQYEVDFVIEDNREEGSAYEVKWNGSTSFTKGQKRFMETYPTFPLKKICWEHPGKDSIDVMRMI